MIFQKWIVCKSKGVLARTFNTRICAAREETVFTIDLMLSAGNM